MPRPQRPTDPEQGAQNDGRKIHNLLKRYLLQQVLGAIQLLLVMLKGGFQVPDLLTLYLHLVRQNTHLEDGDTQFPPQQVFLHVTLKQ